MHRYEFINKNLSENVSILEIGGGSIDTSCYNYVKDKCNSFITIDSNEKSICSFKDLSITSIHKRLAIDDIYNLPIVDCIVLCNSLRFISEHIDDQIKIMKILKFKCNTLFFQHKFRNINEPYILSDQLKFCLNIIKKSNWILKKAYTDRNLSMYNRINAYVKPLFYLKS